MVFVVIIAFVRHDFHMTSEVRGVVQRARAIINRAFGAGVELVEKRTDGFRAGVPGLNGDIDFGDHILETVTGLGETRHPRFEVEMFMRIVGL